MVTTKQRKLAKELLNNAALDKPQTAVAMLEKVGYSTNVAEAKSKDIIESQGVRDALAEYGLTDELITTALVSDIKSKPKNRLGELRLGAELLGKVKEKEPSTSTQNFIQINIHPPHGTDARHQSDTETVPSVASSTES